MGPVGLLHVLTFLPKLSSIKTQCCCSKWYWYLCVCLGRSGSDLLSLLVDKLQELHCGCDILMQSLTWQFHHMLDTLKSIQQALQWEVFLDEISACCKSFFWALSEDIGDNDWCCGEGISLVFATIQQMENVLSTIIERSSFAAPVVKGHCLALNKIFVVNGTNFLISRELSMHVRSFGKSYLPHEVWPLG